MQKVKKSTYSLWRIVAIITLIGTLIGGGYAAYLSLKTVPEQRQLLAANEAFIQKDYRTCIDSLRDKSAVPQTDSILRTTQTYPCPVR